jgi:hypothetical protein
LLLWGKWIYGRKNEILAISILLWNLPRILGQ